MGHAPVLTDCFAFSFQSDPLTRNISITDSWDNCHPVPDNASGPPGLLTYKGNVFVNTTKGEKWPAAALIVMREAGARHAAASSASATSSPPAAAAADSVP